MKKLSAVSDAEWSGVNDFNKMIFDDFLINSAELSKKTIGAYHSNLRIWFIWVKDNLNNKSQLDIKSLDFKRFQNWMINRGCSSSDINNKRAAISSLNNYIEVYYQSEYPTFRNFINKSIKRPPKAFVNEKEPLTKSEFNHLVDVLKEREDWQKVAYLLFTFETGCRRAESRQLTKDIIHATPIVKEKNILQEDGTEVTEHITVYQTKPIRCKGAGETGKVRKLTFGQEAMDAIKKWIDVRGGIDGDACEFVFVSMQDGELKQVSETCFNGWCKSTFANIVGRRIHPHLFRESRATQAVMEDGIDIRQVQKLLGHESSETTEIYVIRHDEDDVDDLF